MKSFLICITWLAVLRLLMYRIKKVSICATSVSTIRGMTTLILTNTSSALASDVACINAPSEFD